MSHVDPRDKRIAELERRVAELEALLNKALARIAELEAENKRLRAKLGENSSNSSRPPSSDPPWTKPRGTKKNKKKRKRKRGGQPGHPRHERELVPVEQVSEVVPLKPERCDCCDRHLKGNDPDPARHQVWDIPRIEPSVVEYQIHEIECKCGVRNRGHLPEGVPTGTFGPNLMALVVLLTGKYRLSKRAVQELCSDILNTPVSLGAVCNIEQTVSEAVARPVEDARDYVRQQPVAYLDETSWRQGIKKAWLWTATTSLVTVFVIALSRGAKVAKAMLGKNWPGILVSDRWKAYDWVEMERRQLCWSHLMRRFQAFVDWGGPAAVVGKKLLDQARLMFQWWHRVRDGTLTRMGFQRKMYTLIDRVLKILADGMGCRNKVVAKTCVDLLGYWHSGLWTFVYEEGVEPTNNSAERSVRHGVLWRKGSFGTQSAAGSRYVERIMTVVMTMKQQRRPILSYLRTACEASLAGKPAPSILPLSKDSYAAVAA